MNPDTTDALCQSDRERMIYLDGTGVTRDHALRDFANRREGSPWTLPEIARWLTLAGGYGIRWLWLAHVEAADDTWLALSLDGRIDLTADGDWTRIEWKEER